MESGIELDVGARWYAGKDRTLTGVSRVGRVRGGLELVRAAYASGPEETYVLFSQAFSWGTTLRELLSRDGVVAGEGGRVELRDADTAALTAAVGAGIEEERPELDQTNALAVLGGRVLVKAYRRVWPGAHPEVELLTALAARHAPVPDVLGSLWWVPADAAAAPAALALLQAYVAGAQDGWERPIQQAVAAIVTRRDASRPTWLAIGEATGRLHTALADAFGWREDPALPAAWVAEALASLHRVDTPEVDALAPRLRAAVERLPAELAASPLATRIHGDLHVAQFLRRPGDGAPPLIVDFEGDPLRSLADRRRPDSPLRDLAGLLRSIDHLGDAAARRTHGASPEAWIASARAAVLHGYAAHAPLAVDAATLHGLELAKECGELLYAHQVLPEWMYAPLAGIRRLLGT